MSAISHFHNLPAPHSGETVNPATRRALDVADNLRAFGALHTRPFPFSPGDRLFPFGCVRILWAPKITTVWAEATPQAEKFDCSINNGPRADSRAVGVAPDFTTDNPTASERRSPTPIVPAVQLQRYGPYASSTSHTPLGVSWPGVHARRASRAAA